MNMDSSILDIIEFQKIRDMISSKASTVMGKELAGLLVPVNDIEQIRYWLKELKEAVDIVLKVDNIPLGGIFDIRPIIKRARLGAMLEPPELLAVSATLYSLRRLKVFLEKNTLSDSIIYELASGIKEVRRLEEYIEEVINEQGNIRDDASSELLRIRRNIKNLQVRVKEKLDAILRSSEYQQYFQDNLVTIRSERYVIPIKHEYRSNFPGIVHDQSASGATLFIEPMPIVDLNNEIKQLMSEEKAEIERLLKFLSGQVALNAEVLSKNAQLAASIDFVFAKAYYSLEINATLPVINTEGYMDLRSARHPLISPDTVVPIDIRIGKDFNTLIITGPNTGGKTVTLKTIGIMAVMMQAGLFIPAASGSQLCIFNNIYADIGDEQSIEQSLSTFSAHMTNLVRIINNVGDKDLVLIDEIGAGTDPNEGAALAMAILDHLNNIGVRTVVTSHYSELKKYAYSTPGVENASVEFDAYSLKPTYRLLIGIPGSSNAFAISRRLGLSHEIIAKAQSFVDFEHAEFEKILSELEKQKLEYDKLNNELKYRENVIAILQKELEEEKRELGNKRAGILAKARNDANTIIRTARIQAEEIITNLKNQYADASARDRQNIVNDARKKLRDQSVYFEAGYEERDEIASNKDVGKISLGDEVYVTNLGQKGTVVSLHNTTAVVQFGSLRMNVPIQNCRCTGNKAKTDNKKENVYNSYITKVQTVPRQIDVRGLTLDEAIGALVKYLDDAILAGLDKVLVVHGKGTGVLKKGIREYLKNNRYVKNVMVADLNEGGDGATVVDLK